jgi:hypothetical protein
MASVHGLAREVVVVDTGSRDATCEVAAALGARVLRTPWEDDFAKARNVALEAASSDWILSMDADQQLDNASRSLLEAALSRHDCDAQRVTIRLLGPPADDGTEHVVQRLSSLRLFRRDPRIRYRWRVHEDVADALIEMGSTHWPDSGVTFTDHGYMEATARARKRERNLALLRLAHDEQPDALYTAYKLAITLPEQDRAERLAVLEDAVKRAMSTSTGALRELPFLQYLVQGAVDGLVGVGRLAEAVDVASHFFERLDSATQSHYALLAGCTAARCGLVVPARKFLGSWVSARRRFNQLRPPQQATAETPGDEDWFLAHQWLAWLSLQDGNHGAASRWIDEGRTLMGDKLHQGLEQVGLQCAFDAGDFQSVSRKIEELERCASRTPAMAVVSMPLMMWASAKLALAVGDLTLASQLAQQSLDLGDDMGSLLLAELQLGVEGRLDALTLQRHYDSIAGRRCDALALKLLIGQKLRLSWPYPVPASLHLPTWAGPVAQLWGVPIR